MTIANGWFLAQLTDIFSINTFKFILNFAYQCVSTTHVNKLISMFHFNCFSTHTHAHKMRTERHSESKHRHYCHPKPVCRISTCTMAQSCSPLILQSLFNICIQFMRMRVRFVFLNICQRKIWHRVQMSREINRSEACCQIYTNSKTWW